MTKSEEIWLVTVSRDNGATYPIGAATKEKHAFKMAEDCRKQNRGVSTIVSCIDLLSEEDEEKGGDGDGVQGKEEGEEGQVTKPKWEIRRESGEQIADSLSGKTNIFVYDANETYLKAIRNGPGKTYWVGGKKIHLLTAEEASSDVMASLIDDLKKQIDRTLTVKGRKCSMPVQGHSDALFVKAVAEQLGYKCIKHKSSGESFWRLEISWEHEDDWDNRHGEVVG